MQKRVEVYSIAGLLWFMRSVKKAALVYYLYLIQIFSEYVSAKINKKTIKANFLSNFERSAVEIHGNEV